MSFVFCTTNAYEKSKATQNHQLASKVNISDAIAATVIYKGAIEFNNCITIPRLKDVHFYL